MEQIDVQVKKGDRVLVTTLTKKMAEDLTAYLRNAGIRVRYMHSEIKALERMEIIRDLRIGEFDVLVGINLLREGLDIPEVSLVTILDADKEGFLRSERSLIQTIGRAARNTDGTVIMYADELTDSMEIAIKENNRRRPINLLNFIAFKPPLFNSRVSHRVLNSALVNNKDYDTKDYVLSKFSDEEKSKLHFTILDFRKNYKKSE